MLTALAAVLSLGLLVLLHEAGHFVVARACRMRVDIFSVGFGPALVSFRGKQTEYRLALVPLGGYVKIAGMAPGDFPPDDPAGFYRRPPWQRALVLVAGPVGNWAFAFLLLATLYTVGFRVPTNHPVIEEVRGRKAAASGLLPGDRVLAVDGADISTWGDVERALAAKPKQAVELRIVRNDVELVLTATPGGDGKLDVRPESEVVIRPFTQAVPLAFLKTWELSLGMLSNLRDWLFGRGEAQLVGPVGIVSETVQAVRKEWLELFFILVQISLALSLMNLMPLPALDGGRLVFVALAAIRRRAIDLRIEATVHAVGVAVLLCLVLWLTWGEVAKVLPWSRPATAAAASAPSMLPDAGQAP
ncbi:MAG TPA: M50 family metallopeptidase [Myxococcales bacterium]|jgi:regulator of sigma E protease